MALKNCEECGAEISSAAAACPKCGAPPPKKKTQWNPVGIVLVAAILGLLIYLGKDHDETSAPQTPTLLPSAKTLNANTSPKTDATKKPDTRDETKYGRCKARLAVATSQGLLVNMAAKITPEIQIGSRFYGLTIDKKNVFLSDVNCFMVHGGTDLWPFDIVDGHSGKRIGHYGVSGYQPE